MNSSTRVIDAPKGAHRRKALAKRLHDLIWVNASTMAGYLGVSTNKEGVMKALISNDCLVRGKHWKTKQPNGSECLFNLPAILELKTGWEQ